MGRVSARARCTVPLSSNTQLRLAVHSPGDNCQLGPHAANRWSLRIIKNSLLISTSLPPATNEREGVVKTVQDQVLTLVGPTYFRQGGFGVRIRLPIFVTAANESETFGGPDQQNPYCGEACYNATTGSKFWGFATALIDLDALSSGSDSRLRSLEQQGLLYELTAPQVLCARRARQQGSQCCRGQGARSRQPGALRQTCSGHPCARVCSGCGAGCRQNRPDTVAGIQELQTG